MTVSTLGLVWIRVEHTATWCYFPVDSYVCKSVASPLLICLPWTLIEATELYNEYIKTEIPVVFSSLIYVWAFLPALPLELINICSLFLFFFFFLFYLEVGSLGLFSRVPTVSLCIGTSWHQHSEISTATSVFSTEFPLQCFFKIYIYIFFFSRQLLWSTC